MTMEDEMTEWPETECEADDGPQPMGGLFSGKGAAKAQKMFLARKARMAKYSSVSYGENTEHPDLEHLNKSDEESSEEEDDENHQVLNHDGHIEAYESENLERIRQKKCAKVEHKLQTTGKGMNLFQKRQQHVQKYIVDQPNENYDKDANHSHLQNGNALNGVNGVNETNGNHSPSPMFSVNLKHVAGKSSEAAGNGHQNGEASFNIQLRQTGQLESLTRERQSAAEPSPKENSVNYPTNGVNGAAKRQQLNHQSHEEDRQSVNSQMSNESAVSTTSLLSTTNTFARGWGRAEDSHRRQSSSTFKSVRAPQGKITSISCSSSIKIGNGGSKPYPSWNAKNTPSPRNSLPDVATFQQNSNFQKPSSHSAGTFQPQAPSFRAKPAPSEQAFSPASTLTPTPVKPYQNNQSFSSNAARPAAPPQERTRSSSWAPTAQKISSNGFTKKAPPPPPAGKPSMSPLLSRRLAASPAPSVQEQGFNYSPRNSCSSQPPETFKSSFSDLQIGSPMTQRKLSNPPAKQEIELRSPVPKVSNFSLQWDQNSSNFHNEPEPESNSINIEDVSCQSESRQPDIVVDFDMKSPAPSYLNGNSCHTPTVEDEQFQEDTASVTSFNSEVFEQQQAMEAFASAPAAPAPPSEAPAPPKPEPVEQSSQMTPTANLMASAFKMSAVPKLRKVAEPKVKWGGQEPVSQDRVHNSVKEEQNRVFQDQQRQRIEQQKREMEDKRVREEASRVQQAPTPPSAQFAPLKNASAQHSRRVHFSEAEGLRQQQGPLSYNKAATGFRANSLPEAPAKPVGRPVNVPQTSRSAAPRPKFMAKSTNSKPMDSWSSPSIGNGEVPQIAATEVHKPATAPQKPQPNRWQPSAKPNVPPLQIPEYPSGNSIVMDNLDATYNSPPLPQSAHRRVPLSPPQKTPPPTPTKPSWYPGMRADPMQFSGRKNQYKTGPPPPAPKIGVASSDILAGPSRLADKFELNKPAKQEFVPDASRLKLFQDLIDHHDKNRPRGGSGSRPGSRNGFTSLRDGYESDSGLAYRSKTTNFSQFNNGPAKAQEAPATFVFDPMQSRGRGAKMFERQKNRMGKFTRDHREDYEQFKGQQTKNESFQHQVPVLPALSSVPPKPSLARPQRKNKELGDFNRIMNRSGNRPAPNVWSPSGAQDF